VLLTCYVRHVLIREEELDACSDGGIDDDFGWVVLGSAAGDAIRNGVLSGESFDKGRV
jgi:hypothetical protein